MEGLKTEKFSGKIENAYGKKLDAVLSYDAEFDAYVTIEQVKAANDMPKDDEIIDWRNQQRKANARQKAMQATLDAAGIVKPTLENDEQLRLRKMYDIFVANGDTPEAAKVKAAAALSLEWSE